MLLSHKGIRTVADFQGQKIRTQGGAPIQVEPLKKVGAIPVSLPLGEASPQFDLPATPAHRQSQRPRIRIAE